MQSGPLHTMGTGDKGMGRGHVGCGHGRTGEECPGKKETSFPLHTLKQQKALLFSSQVLYNTAGFTFNKAILGRPSDPMDPVHLSWRSPGAVRLVVCGSCQTLSTCWQVSKDIPSLRPAAEEINTKTGQGGKKRKIRKASQEVAPWGLGAFTNNFG